MNSVDFVLIEMDHISDDSDAIWLYMHDTKSLYPLLGHSRMIKVESLTTAVPRKHLAQTKVTEHVAVAAAVNNWIMQYFEGYIFIHPQFLINIKSMNFCNKLDGCDSAMMINSVRILDKYVVQINDG